MTSRVSVVAAVAAVFVACIKIPAFQGDDGDGGTGDANGDASGDGSIPEGSGASAEMVGNQVIARLPGLYEMKFSESGYRFPYNWTVGAQQKHVLGSPTDSGCTLERDASVAMLPAHVFTSVATGGATSTSSEIEIELEGPHVAKVRLEWGASVESCGANPIGASTFSFFPDGRISRLDYVRQPGMHAANECACAANADWRIAGATTFNRLAFVGVQGLAYPPPTDAVGTSFSNIACLEAQEGFRIAMGFKNTRGTRLRSPDGSTFAILGDLVTPAQTLTGGGNNGHLGDATTTYWVSLQDSCTALRARVMPFTEDPQIELEANGSPLTIGLAQDGIYGGETAFARGGRGAGATTIVVRPATASLGAFALWLDFGSHARPTPPILSKTPTTPVDSWYAVQRPATRPSHYVFWFPGGLATGESITIRTE